MSTVKANAHKLKADLASEGTPNTFPEQDLLRQMHPAP